MDPQGQRAASKEVGKIGPLKRSVLGALQIVTLDGRKSVHHDFVAYFHETIHAMAILTLHQSTFESVLTTSMSKQQGLIIFGVPETSEFTKPPASFEFCGFSFRKIQERASKFGSILGRDRGLVNNCSAAIGRARNWTGRILNSFYTSEDYFWLEFAKLT